MKKFKPRNGHIMILPKVVEAVAKKVSRDDGSTAEIIMTDRTRDEKIKAVNQGTVNRTSSSDPNYQEGSELVYYPFSANKFIEDEVEYHIIHEKDVMGYLSEVS